MTKTAWVFPGQGSQFVGMGIDLYNLPAAKEKFDLAEDILGWSVLEICKEEDKISRTLYTQPCLYVIECILVSMMREKGHSPQLVAGHSLGEYVALYAAGVFNFEAGLRLVKRRAELMDTVAGGKMVALIKFDREQLQDVLDKTPNAVLANDNSEAQVVISGTPEAMDNVVSQIKTKRAIPLNVSGAFHSPLMSSAAQEFQPILDAVAFEDATIPVLSNVEPTPAVGAKELKERLSQQMTGSVRWREIMLQCKQEGVTQVVEVGPGNVLTGLMKRTFGDLKFVNVGRVEDLNGDF